MSNGRYLKSIMLGYGLCGFFFNFAGGGMSRLDRALIKIEHGPPQSLPQVSDVIEMQPLLGPTRAGAEWVVYYEPKNDKDWENNDSGYDEWLSHMEEEAACDKIYPTYRAMSTYPQYTAMSVSKPVLEIPLKADEEGTVRFVKNQNSHEPESTCCDRLVESSLAWCKTCASCGIGYWWVKLTSRDEKYGFNSRNKSGAVVRKDGV